MAINTILTYALDGSRREFEIPFEYLARKFIVVTLIGQDRRELIVTDEYRFLSKTAIQTTKAWGLADGYERIELRRNTSATDRLVNFNDGSILRAYEMNISQIQTLHVAEEARNMVADTISENEAGHLDARGRRIANLANAVDPRDAITLGQVQAEKDNAFQSAARAKTSETNAKDSETKAKTSETNAKDSETKAKTSETNAKNSEVAANQWMLDAAGYRDQANTARSAAQQSAVASQQSAVDAAGSNSAAAQAANRANADAALVLANIASYGANPVGTVVMGIKDVLPGHLMLDGSSFSGTEFPELAAYLGSTTLPDYRGRYPKGASVAEAVRSLGAGAMPQHNHSVPAHSHTGSTSTHSHTHTISGTAETAGSHSHTYTDPLIGNDGITVGSGSGLAKYRVASNAGTTIASGSHSHNVSGSTSQDSHSHTVTITEGGATTTGNAGSGATVEVNRFHINFFIKAKGLAQA